MALAPGLAPPPLARAQSAGVSGRELLKVAWTPGPEPQALARQLLEADVPLERVKALLPELPEPALHLAARQAVQQRPDAALGALVLERSRTAAHDSEFLDALVKSFATEAPEELVDPLMLTLMSDPVVLSSGYVLDRSSCLKDGKLRFQCCPFTRARLEPKVYPLVPLVAKLKQYKLGRLDQLLDVASRLQQEDARTHHAKEVIEMAGAFLDDLGEQTYQRQAARLAELELADPTLWDDPARLAPVLRRLRAHDAARAAELGVLVLAKAEEALGSGDGAGCAQWLDAYGSGGDALAQARLRLRLAKHLQAEGEDLLDARGKVFALLDPAERPGFLAAEGVTEEALVLEPQVVVAGAGFVDVNGVYTQSGVADGVPQYVCAEKSMTLLRYRFGSGFAYWFLSKRGASAAADIDYYRTERTEAAVPPVEGWKALGQTERQAPPIRGRAPAPALTLRGVTAAASAARPRSRVMGGPPDRGALLAQIREGRAPRSDWRALSPADATLSVGTRVRCNFWGRESATQRYSYYPGRIRAVNDDGTYHVTYDDGDWARAAPSSSIQVGGAESESASLASDTDPALSDAGSGASDIGY